MLDSLEETNFSTEEVIADLKDVHTVNSEIFAGILFSRRALKDIFATLKIRDFDMIYLYMEKSFSPFHEGFIFAKLRIREVSRK